MKKRSIVNAPHESPEKRRLRVRELRRRLANGTYRPDLEAVARRLIAELCPGAGWN